MKKEDNPLTGEVILSRLRSFCAYRERSEQEIRQRALKWQLPEERIIELIDQLKQEGFLNEKRFAQSFSQGKLRLKGWGKLKVKQALRQKGIDNESTDEALGSFDAEEYGKSIQKNLSKKAITLKALPVREQKQKLINYLLQKGFETDLVWKAVEEYFRKKN